MEGIFEKMADAMEIENSIGKKPTKKAVAAVEKLKKYFTDQSIRGILYDKGWTCEQVLTVLPF